MVDETDAAQPFDARGEGADRHRVAGHGDRDLGHDFLAEVAEVHGGLEHLRDDSPVGDDALGEQIGGPLRVTDLVGGDPRQELRQTRSLAVAA